VPTADFGQILTSPDDLGGIREMLGFEPSELGDDVLLHPWVLGAGERFVMKQLPAWALIMQLTQPAAPVLAATTVSPPTSLLAATYYVILVARAAGIPSPPGVEASQVITVGQRLDITIPTSPGIQSYDVYVGTAATQEFLQQAGLTPGGIYSLLAFSLAGPAIGAIGAVGPEDVTEQGDLANLKSATQAACAAHLCKRMQRKVPREFRSYSFSEIIDVDWRHEESAMFEDAAYYLGLVTGYIAGLAPPPAAMIAHPKPKANDPSYISGTDPNAIPGAFGTYTQNPR